MLMVSGGGKRAVIGSFQPNDSKHDRDQVLLLYILVGDYWKVGKWPDDDDDTPSIWETARLLTEAMQRGVSTKILHRHITEAIEIDEALRKME